MAGLTVSERQTSMKMVLVYDTDNHDDYEASVKIMRKLVNDYDTSRHGTARNLRSFGMIQFIKILREWEKVAATSPRSPGKDVASLKAAKMFTDEIWKEHE